MVEGGHPLSIVSAGYIGSTLLGATFVLAGFDTLLSKKMSWVIGFGLILPLAIVREMRQGPPFSRPGDSQPSHTARFF